MSRNYEIARRESGDLVVHEYLDAFVMATVDAALAAQMPRSRRNPWGLAAAASALPETILHKE